jgi:hypothetical protein
MPFRSEDDEELIKHVLEFFVSYPRAADTVEGVARWRLLELTVHQTIQETERAIEVLVEKGFLKRTPVHGSEDLFSLNEEERSAAQAFLAQKKKRRESGQ